MYFSGFSLKTNHRTVYDHPAATKILFLLLDTIIRDPAQACVFLCSILQQANRSNLIPTCIAPLRHRPFGNFRGMGLSTTTKPNEQDNIYQYDIICNIILLFFHLCIIGGFYPHPDVHHEKQTSQPFKHPANQEHRTCQPEPCLVRNDPYPQI